MQNVLVSATVSVVGLRGMGVVGVDVKDDRR